MNPDLTTHKIRIPSRTVFEPAIPGVEQPQTHALDRVATETGGQALRAAGDRVNHNFSTVGT
jgi:hypothetical protein